MKWGLAHIKCLINVVTIHWNCLKETQVASWEHTGGPQTAMDDDYRYIIKTKWRLVLNHVTFKIICDLIQSPALVDQLPSSLKVFSSIFQVHGCFSSCMLVHFYLTSPVQKYALVFPTWFPLGILGVTLVLLTTAKHWWWGRGGSGEEEKKYTQLY